ncbi:MAG: copper-translocating P-type ATPase [Prolixibacteraceae bacterium]|nr:copper-translocating P-type ATPase [Prolixibacteraceae bacterium]
MKTSVKKNFPVTGLSCASCAISVESMLKAQSGVLDASVNYANSSVWVEYMPETASVADFKTAIQSIGYDLLIEDEGHDHQEELQQIHYKKLKTNTLWASLLAFPVVVIAMFLMYMPYANWIMLVLSTPVIVWFGRGFFVNAYKQAQHGKANMDTLVALSTGIAYLFSLFSTFFPEFWHSRGQHPHVYFEAAAVVIAFILLGKVLEERAKSNTSSAIKKLIGLQSNTVNLIHDNGQEEEIPVSQVKVGYRLLVKPGDKIPVDGEIVSGSSFIDESTITGESLPVEKEPGGKVFAGTINQKGSFVFVAQKVGGETILAQIIKMVQEAQGSKPPVQKLVDQIAGIFVPVVMVIAVISFVTWMILGGDNAVTQALLAMVSVLVIACPCALGLATPTAIMVGMGKGAENGILIKDAESLELSHKVNAVVLDKTGTVTEGKPAVTDMAWTVSGDEKAALEQMLYAIELQSEHPLAEAVTASLKIRSGERIVPDKFESITGRGVAAHYGNRVYLVGNQKFLTDYRVSIPESSLARMKAWQHEAKTVICFARDTELLAVIAIADQIKETSAKAIADLQNQGIEVYMLTGDNEQTAKAVARKVGLKNFKAEVMPSDKAEFIQQLQRQGKVVAMVGDGINDSHALAQADVSIAMGKGSDIAMDVAKMTIISSDLQLIPRAIRLSKQTVRTIHENLFWAFIYNLIGIPIAAGILFPIWGFMLNPMIAGAAMALSSVSVVSNSLRLKFKKLD